VWKDGWSETHHTVLPETMFNYTIDGIIKYPNKKFIVHFIQPHFPYIGYDIQDESLKKLRNSIITNSKPKTSINLHKSIFSLYAAEIYMLIDKQKQIKAYKNNLEITLPYVEKLINLLPGSTVVTADHGEAFGERIHPFLPFKYYGHRAGLRIPVLIDIPWLLVKHEEKDTSKVKEVEEKNKIQKTIKGLSLN